METSISIDVRWISIKALLFPKSSTTVKRRWNGSSAALNPSFEGNQSKSRNNKYFVSNVISAILFINLNLKDPTRMATNRLH